MRRSVYATSTQDIQRCQLKASGSETSVPGLGVNVGALMITYTVFGAPYSIRGPKPYSNY